MLAPELTKTVPYPVALIPGQFQEYYKRSIRHFAMRCQCFTLVFSFPNANLNVAYYRYSPNELRYLPVSTALYEPPLDPELPALDSEPDSDDEGNEDKKNKNSSVRHQTRRELHQLTIDQFSSLLCLTHA